MNDRTNGLLAGLRVLVVEDEHLVALALADDLEDAGAVVVGPAFSLEAAQEWVVRGGFDAAVLDIRLQSQLIFPVARMLVERAGPFLFTTGFDGGIVPAEYAHVPKGEKPGNPRTGIETLARLARGGA